VSIAPEEVGDATVVVPSRHVGTVAVDDRVVLVDEEAGRGYALNPSASLIWRLFDGESAIGELVDDISEILGVPHDEVHGSVTGLASFLGELGLLEGVRRSVASLPIDIEYVDLDDCGEVVTVPAAAQEMPTFDSRYLAAPPNV